MDKVLKGIPKVECYIDDILVGGSSIEKCQQNLVQVLERLNKYRIQVRLEKCRFFQSEIDYLGHRICADGIKPSKK